MTNDNVTRLPEPGVMLDLDTLERDQKDVKEPFVVNVGGKRITFNDPTEVDWRDLASISGPGDLIRVALSREDRRHLGEQEMPTWKFSKLMDAYSLHYNLEEKIENARRQSSVGLSLDS